MPTPHVLFNIDGPIAVVTINRPDARNAMTWDMYEGLVEACERVDLHDDLRVFVLACDMRVCTPEARFGVPIARTLGNCLSAANYARLVDLIGPARTKDILFTGRLIEAAEADSLGLVTRMAPLSELDGVVRSLATALAANAPLTIRATKEAVRRIQAHRRLDAGLVDDLISMCYGSADFMEGVAAFLAKRPPHFTGR